MIVNERAQDDTLKPDGFKVNTGNLLLCSFAINILALALPVMTLQVYDRILPNPGSGTLPVLIAGVCIAIALESALRLARGYSLNWSGAVYEHRLSCSAMNHIIGADLSRFGTFGIGEELHRMLAIGKLKDFYNGYALVTLSDLVFVPIFLGLVIYIAGPLAVVPTAILMIFTLVSLANGQKLRGALKSRDKTDDERYNFLIESLEGVHTLKAFALENIFARRYEALEKESTHCNYRVTEAIAGTFNAGSVFSHVMVAAVISIGAVLAMHGHITTGALIATVMLSGRMMQPIQRALALWAKYQDYTLSRRKVEALFEIAQHETIAGNDDEIERTGAVTLNNVGFMGKDPQNWLLKDINLDLGRGESISLQADNSAVRHALLKLISGIYSPTQGEILIDGHNSLRFKPQKLVKHVGYIQSEGLIFRGTICDNMTCFGQIPEADAQEIAALLNITRDVARLPSGFDTFLSGNNTDSVPPGLKQRIAMVRVLAPKPRIIIFDSADRSLDREGYNLVYNLLARIKGKATMILISDDYNIRGLAERFFILENGTLTENVESQNPNHFHPFKELRL